MDSFKFNLAILLILIITICPSSMASSSRRFMSLYKPPPNLLTYHNGTVLQGTIPVSIIWYGQFTPVQKSIISDFFLSLSQASQNPSVSQWWSNINQLYLLKAGIRRSNLVLANQLSDDKCSIGKSLTMAQISSLAKKARTKKGGISIVLTALDIAVEGFCMNRCGTHGRIPKPKSTFIWVGNSATQCPGQCAWPYHQPLYGPQTPPLVPPNGDVGTDGMIINLASMIASTVTNPFGDGFYQGEKEAPLEASTACTGIYGKGAFSGYPGRLMVDPRTGASYNANGVRGRKYLLPALFDPMSSSCSTLV